MFCSKRQKDLVDCDCPDLEDRLEQLRKSPYIDPGMINRIVDQRLLKKTKGRKDSNESKD